jgi:fermentation-respiration switch protein FrsA (DUF1100 family)
LSCEAVVNKMTFFPDTSTQIPREQLADHIREIFITTGDSVRIQAYYFSGKARQEGLVIYFHGNAGNICHRIGDAELLFKTGHDVLLVSYRGYGKSQGRPSEKGIYKDAQAALDYAADTLGYPLKRTYIYGRSLGSTVAVHVAQDKELAGLILITPLTSAREYAKASHMGPFQYIAGNAFNSIDKIGRMRCPALFIHGDKDEVIPYKLGKKLYEAYPGEKKFVTVPGGGHNDLDFVNPELYWSSVRAFLAR